MVDRPVQRFKTCFISAPPAMNTAFLRTALEDRSIDWSDHYSLDLTGFSLLDSVDSAIAKVDFVCVVLPSDTKSGWELFELGLAFAHRRPVLLLIVGTTSIPNQFLQSMPYVRIEPDQTAGLDLHLDAFLQHADRRLVRRTSSRRRKTIDPEVKAFPGPIDKRDIASVRQPESVLEAKVAKLLEQAGGVVSLKPAGSNRGVDMAVWMDVLQYSLGSPNPLLVEVKGTVRDRGALRAAEQQLRLWVTETAAAAGILVIGESPLEVSDTPSAGYPLIFCLKVDDLVALVDQGRLVHRLIEARNRAAHPRI